MYSKQVLILLFSVVIPAISCFSLKHYHPSLSTSPTSKLRKHASILEMKQGGSDKKYSKRLILIRHGCTFMNEYLATPGSRWGDANFTDVFDSSEDSLYRDSPLSNKGKAQAQDLHHYFQSTETGKQMIRDIELIAVSPLRRTLQTAEISVLPHLQDSSSIHDIPIVALPLASERVYLKSDHGRCKNILSREFPFADFGQEFDRFEENWWFTVEETKKMESGRSEDFHSFASMHIDDYIEWRPNDHNQIYSCHGEPDDLFEQRMIELYNWLDNRDESVICLVCHWGVLDWLTGKDFRNCEVRDISFEDVRTRVLRSQDQKLQT